MAAKIFVYPVKGFSRAHHHDDHDQLVSCFIALTQWSPEKKHDEKPDQADPFKEFHFREKGNERKRKARSGRLKAQSRTKGVGFGGEDFNEP